MKAIVILISAAGLGLAGYGIHQDQRQRELREFNARLDQKNAAALVQFQQQLQTQAAHFQRKQEQIQRDAQYRKDQLKFEQQMNELVKP